MMNFFKSTYYFWVVSKIIFILLGTISVLQILTNERLAKTEFLINIFFLFYISLMAITSIKELRGIQSKSILNIIVGSLSLLTGLALMITFILLGNERLQVDIILALLFSLWIMLIGLSDLFKRKYVI
jgi:hypothetical protein